MKRFNWTPSSLTILRKKCKTHTAQQVADEIGCSKSQAYTQAKKQGWSFKKYGDNHHSTKYPDHDVYLARALIDEGIAKAEVSRKLEIPLHAISEWSLNKYRNNDSVHC